MLQSTVVKAAIEAKFAELVEKALVMHPKAHAIQYTKFDYSLKGCTGGEARLQGFQLIFRVNLGMASLDQENLDMYLNEVVPHELAHLIDYCLRGKSAHDRIWRGICLSLGGSGSRCHSLKKNDAECRKTRRFEYTIGAEKLTITAARHNKVQKGVVYRTAYGILDNTCSFKQL